MSEMPSNGDHGERIRRRIKRIAGAHEKLRKSHRPASLETELKRAELDAQNPPADQGTI
jgi:hypothetical protein